MLLGKVIGTLVTCVAYEGLTGVPMLWVRPVDKHGKDAGKAIVCADATRMAGPGELVYYEGGREAAMALEPWPGSAGTPRTPGLPVDHTIIGIVDQVHVE
jgi:ethanolamine utilization protein EutN